MEVGGRAVEVGGRAFDDRDLQQKTKIINFAMETQFFDQ